MCCAVIPQYPEPFRALIAQGAELIIVPSFWTLHLPPDLEAINPLGEAVYLDAAIVARAYDNQVCVVFVNAGGPADQKFAGRTMVVMPGAGKVAEAKGPEVEEVLADVDLGVLKKAENHYKLRGDAVGGVEWWPYGGVMGCGRTSKI